MLLLFTWSVFSCYSFGWTKNRTAEDMIQIQMVFSLAERRKIRFTLFGKCLFGRWEVCSDMEVTVFASCGTALRRNITGTGCLSSNCRGAEDEGNGWMIPLAPRNLQNSPAYDSLLINLWTSIAEWTYVPCFLFRFEPFHHSTEIINHNDK